MTTMMQSWMREFRIHFDRRVKLNWYELSCGFVLPFFCCPHARRKYNKVYLSLSHTHNDCKMLIICWFFISRSLRSGYAAWLGENLMKTFFPHVWKFSFEAEKPQIIIFVKQIFHANIFSHIRFYDNFFNGTLKIDSKAFSLIFAFLLTHYDDRKFIADNLLQLFSSLFMDLLPVSEMDFGIYF